MNRTLSPLNRPTDLPSSGGSEDLPATEPSAPAVLAFYLPQYHPIPENDEWWGAGFTEWTNVARARPRFPGHFQPRIPGELGFYDLRLPETRAAQAGLAREHGVTAFCYWHYWFGGGKQLLERPFAEVLGSGEPDFPFCLAWANQSWSGVWHGAPGRILQEQTYPGLADHRAHFEHLLPAFFDPRYFRVAGKPLVYIYFPGALPEVQRFLDLWRAWAADAGLPGIYFVGGSFDSGPPTEADFDAFVVARAPHLYIRRREVPRRLARLAGVPPIHSYREFARRGPQLLPGVKSLPCVLPGFDNTPRSGAGGVVLHGATPEEFRGQVERAVAAVAELPSEERIIFVKSWNEWAEGNYLEPDRRYGRGFLQALRDGLPGRIASAPVAGPRQLEEAVR
jgi:lipopolysaccharide biosynthesis protein